MMWSRTGRTNWWAFASHLKNVPEDNREKRLQESTKEKMEKNTKWSHSPMHLLAYRQRSTHTNQNTLTGLAHFHRYKTI